MSNIEAFLLGLFVTLLILLPFFILSMQFNVVSDAYLSVLCKQASTFPLVLSVN